jgi:hypothetical protein
LEAFLLLLLSLAVVASALFYNKVRREIEKIREEDSKPKSQELTELKEP